MMRHGRLAWIKSYWARQSDRGEVSAGMAQKHIAELIAEVERTWTLFPRVDPPLGRPDHVCRLRDIENG
jgi:hypothetical protein